MLWSVVTGGSVYGIVHVKEGLFLNNFRNSAISTKCNCGNERFEDSGVSARSIHQTPKVVPCPHQFGGHRNLPTGLSVGLMQVMT